MTEPYDGIEAWISHRAQTVDDSIKAHAMLTTFASRIIEEQSELLRAEINKSITDAAESPNIDYSDIKQDSKAIAELKRIVSIRSTGEEKEAIE